MFLIYSIKLQVLFNQELFHHGIKVNKKKT